jgi:membrane protein YqaA with SNARE-associated domain
MLIPELREVIENISKYPVFQNLLTALMITFWVCLIGNLIPFPTPYPFVICFSSAPFLQLHILIPLLVGFVASFGCLVGEMGGYLLGRGASRLLSEENRTHLKDYEEFLTNHPKLAPLAIYLAGFTPIPDDLITIPLGLLRYSIFKTVFWVWLGKLSLMLVFAYNIFNICALFGGESWILSFITLYIIVILVYLMLKIDLISLINKIFKKNPKK